MMGSSEPLPAAPGRCRCPVAWPRYSLEVTAQTARAPHEAPRSRHPLALALSLLLALAPIGAVAAGAPVDPTPEAAAAPSEADPFATEVDEIIEGLMALPGDEIRGAYLGGVLQTAPRELAARVRVAVDLLEILEPFQPPDDRLRGLLRAALAPAPATREAAIEAARTGAPAPEVDEYAPPTFEEPDVEQSGADFFSDLTEGVAGIKWGLSALEVQGRLGADARVLAARAWPGPRYLEDLAVLSVDRDLLGCSGEMAYLFSAEGLWRVWFTAEDAACWDSLGAGLQRHLGSAPERERYAPEGRVLVREWEDSGRVTLGVSVEEGEPVGAVYLHLQPPGWRMDSLSAPGDTIYGPRRGEDRQDSRETRGWRLKRKAGAHLGVGFGFMAVALGTGIGTLAVWQGGEEGYSPEAFIGLGFTSVGTATVSAIFLIVGGSMDVHANILLGDAGQPGRSQGAEFRLAIGVAEIGIEVRY